MKIMGSITAASITASPLSAYGGGVLRVKGTWRGGCIFVNHVFSRVPDSDRIERSWSGTGVLFPDKSKRGRLHREGGRTRVEQHESKDRKLLKWLHTRDQFG